MKIQIKTEFENQFTDLVWELSKVSEREVGMLIQLSVGEHVIRFPCLLLGYDFACFVDELRTVHSRLQGAARLVSFDEQITLSFTIEDPKRGIVSIKCESLSSLCWSTRKRAKRSSLRSGNSCFFWRSHDRSIVYPQYH